MNKIANDRLISMHEARARNLPGSELLLNHHIRYVDDLHMKYFAAFIYREAYHVFCDLAMLKDSENLLRERAEKDKWSIACDLTVLPPDEPFTKQYVCTKNYENMKVGTAFEMSLKARLAELKYIVHKINPEITEFKELSIAQKNRPIYIEELLAIEPFVFNGQYNFHRAITDSTVSFWILCNKPQYKEVLELDQESAKFVDECRSARNKIHFPESFGITISDLAMLYDKGIFVKDFCNEQVVARFNQISNQHMIGRPQLNIIP